MLLKSLDGEYREYLLGADFSDRQFRAEFGSEAVYPQITIGGKHIGSLKETLQYFQQKDGTMINLELSREQAISLLLLIDRECADYTSGPACPARITFLREVVAQLDTDLDALEAE